MNKNKFISLISITTASVCLSSCIHTEENTELKIVSECAQNICHIEVVQADILRTTNILGKTTERILNKTPLVSSNNSLTWSISGGSFANSQQMLVSSLPACENDNCSPTSNPTGYIFPTGPATHAISVSGNVTLPDGTTKEINQSANVIIEDQSVITQITITGGDYSQVASSGTAPASGISWITDQGNPGYLTWTCPSGYAIPSNATAPAVGTILTLNNADETYPGKDININGSGVITQDFDAYLAGVFVAYNLKSNFVITCVPNSGVSGYS